MKHCSRQNALLVVTSSLSNLQTSLKQSDLGPEIKKSVAKNGRDVIVIIDKALKHPIVVTGIAKFAKSKGIPHAEALLQLASLGLAKILKSIPPENTTDQAVEEVDAAELEMSSPADDTKVAHKIGKEGDGSPPETEDVEPYKKFKRDNQCLIA